MSSEILKINGEWLKWARETAYFDLDSISKRINESPETILKWEEEGIISFKDLEKISKEYKRPTTIFFNNDSPIYPNEIPDFRTLDSKKIPITPEIAFELRRAKNIRETFIELIDDLEDFEVPQFDLYKFNQNNMNYLLENLRIELGMGRANNKKNFNHWINVLESFGVLVFEFYNINPQQLRGYALYYDKLPIIGINVKEKPVAKKFTLFHELAHLIIKKEGISNINTYNFYNYDEKICNKIAAELLLPSNLFENYVKNNPSVLKFEKKDILFLSQVFGVSNQVIVRKALDLKFITEKQYHSRIKEFNTYINPVIENNNKKSYKRKEDTPIDIKKGIHQKAVIALRKNGKYFSNFIFKAYEEDLISDIDLALELDVSLEVMRELRNIIYKEDFNGIS